MTYWLAVASEDLVRQALKDNFFQPTNGKRSALLQTSLGDGILYHSPQRRFEEATKGDNLLQQFTAVGYIAGEVPKQVEVSPSFRPYRLPAEYLPATPASIRPLLEELSFTRGRKYWGQRFRSGFMEISERDFQIVAEQMNAQLR